MNRRILHVITSIDNGGAENHLYDLISEQVKTERIFVIYFKGNNYHKKNLVNKGVRVFKINFEKKNFLFLFVNFFKFFKIYKKITPDIVHCHLWLSEIYGFFLKLINPNSFLLVISKHLDSFIFEGSFGTRKFIRGIFFEKILFNYSDHIIFISKAVKKFFLENIRIKKEKYSIIRYGLNTKKFFKLPRREIINIKRKLNISNKTLIIGCIARHVEQKSLDIVIKSFSMFAKKNSEINSKLIMIGKGHLQNELRYLAKSLNISNKVIWIRSANNINLYFNIFDMLCLSSKYEGFGLVLLESLASGVPVLATRSGAIPEIIENKKNGYLVQHGDIKNFSKRINDTLALKKNITFKKNLFNSKNLFSLNKVYVETDKAYSNAKNVKSVNESKKNSLHN